MKIMVVENDPLTAAALAMILNDAGHHVVGPVASVRDALARVGPDAPDLVLVDVELGRGGSGIALARGLKRHYDVPSVFVTADAARARTAMDAALGLILKPIDGSRVLVALDCVCVMMGGAGNPADVAGLEIFRGTVRGAGASAP